MAGTAGDIGITRQEVYDWVQEARAKKVNIREHVRARIEDDIRASGKSVQIGDEVKQVVDHILDDLDNYL